MALIGRDFKSDPVHFLDLYTHTYESFIELYKRDNISIDLTGKVVVAVESFLEDDRKVPMDILAIYIDESERYNNKVSLIYAGHISFIKIVSPDGKITYYYKDDECHPQTYEEFLSYESDILYTWSEERGNPKEDILIQVESLVKGFVDVNYKLDPANLIILEGL